MVTYLTSTYVVGSLFNLLAKSAKWNINY